MTQATSATVQFAGRRSWLFTPATKPDRFDRAAGAGADALIIDLEDAVAPADKASARQAALRPWLVAVWPWSWVARRPLTRPGPGQESRTDPTG